MQQPKKPDPFAACRVTDQAFGLRLAFFPPTVIRIAWRLLKGYRLRPWRSPYLRWRIETWSGIEAAGITPVVFFRFSWTHRADLVRYLRWADANSRDLSRSW